MVSFAQAPTLTAANFNPQFNDGFVNHVCDTTGVSAGLPGPNVTWNYGGSSGLITTLVDTGKAVPVSSTSPGSLIAAFSANSNIAVITPTAGTSGASMTTYANESSSKLSNTGYYQSMSQNAVYTDPIDQLHYPVNYSNTDSDTYAGYITINGNTFHGSGVVYDTVDGWGTLKLPGGLTYLNVLRIHTSQIFVDSADLFGHGIATFIFESYNWYMPNYHSALMTINTAVGTGLALGYYYKVVSYASQQISNAGVPGIDQIGNSLQLYPNPLQNELNVRFNLPTEKKVSVSIADMLGREMAVISDKYNKGVQNIKINTTSFPKGLYLVHLNSGDETVTRKIAIQ